MLGQGVFKGPIRYSLSHIRRRWRACPEDQGGNKNTQTPPIRESFQLTEMSADRARELRSGQEMIFYSTLHTSSDTIGSFLFFFHSSSASGRQPSDS
jgi:hypothetical protein